MTAYRLGPAADYQLDQIYDYTADRWGDDQADRYIQALFDYFGKVAAKTIAWRSIPAEFEVDGYVGKFEHHFVYWKQLKGGNIAIVAVFHERMHQIDRLRDLFAG